MNSFKFYLLIIIIIIIRFVKRQNVKTSVALEREKHMNSLHI